MKKTHVRIGVDTGGTFTDFAFYAGGDLKVKKIPSTPHDPSSSILAGIKEYFRNSNPLLIIHGTTVATNSLLEKKGKRTALITTKGFEDVLFIGRQVRKNLYSLRGEKKDPLLPKKYCYGINERVSPSGKIEKRVSPQEIRDILEKIRKNHIKAVAVCLIHSYANPENEKIIRQKLAEQNILFSISSEILPEHREYERTTVTTVNAFLMPIISQSLQNLEKKLGRTPLRIMQSNEGYISSRVAKSEPIRTALSGPAGGVVGAFQIGRSAGYGNIISFDMGGTSSDVSLIAGEIRRTSESVIGDFPIRLPIIDIHTVGAGGGSVAYIDQGGSLRVGPQSAGADPGPACYGKGTIPTVTDANLLLGRLDPDFVLGGRMKIYPERSQKAVAGLAKKINKSLMETAAGIIKIANVNMEKAIRVISIERGYDPRNFSLFSFGGAGAMHAADIASDLKIANVLVPKNAGVLSAIGLLMADCIQDYSKSVLKLAEKIKEKELNKLFHELRIRSLKSLKKEGFKEPSIQIYPFLDLRYMGQSYEITIPFHSQNGSIQPLIKDFHEAHQKLYAYHHLEIPVEIVNIRVKAVGLTQKIKLKKRPPKKSNPQKSLKKTQPLHYKGRKYTAPVYDRALLEPGCRLQGPALAVDYESTTFLPPSYSLQVDGLLNLVITKNKV
jgi:N-methylhydantoinase A/oxoprolinase/acetone carboxylase beta subunit